MALTTRLGLMTLAADGDTLTDVDYNQLGKALDAAKRAVWDALGGEGIYSGGASVLADITAGATYPALTAVLYDDSGVPWSFVKSTGTAITFTDTAGACTLYLVPALLTGVSPSAAAGGKLDFSLVCQLTASAAPAHSLVLGAGTVAASAFTTWTPASVFIDPLTTLLGVPTSRTVTAGTGLSGGGDLSANRTLSIDQAAALTLSALSPYASLRAILTDDQTGVANGDFVAVNWTNATRTLTGLAWDSGTATRLTVSTGYGGLYLLVGTLAWDANATGQRFVAIYVNGSLVMQCRPSYTLATVIPILQVTYLGALAAGDYVELRGYHDSGADRTYKASSTGAQVSLYGVRMFA